MSSLRWYPLKSGQQNGAFIALLFGAFRTKPSDRQYFIVFADTADPGIFIDYATWPLFLVKIFLVSKLG